MTHSIYVNRAGFLTIIILCCPDVCSAKQQFHPAPGFRLLAFSVGQLFLAVLFSAYGISLLRLGVCTLSFHLGMLLI